MSIRSIAAFFWRKPDVAIAFLARNSLWVIMPITMITFPCPLLFVTDNKRVFVASTLKINPFSEADCGNCNACLGEVEREDATVAA